MSRKKRFYIIFSLVLLAALTLFLATACEKHEHNYVARNNTAGNTTITITIICMCVRIAGSTFCSTTSSTPTMRLTASE